MDRTLREIQLIELYNAYAAALHAQTSVNKELRRRVRAWTKASVEIRGPAPSTRDLDVARGLRARAEVAYITALQDFCDVWLPSVNKLARARVALGSASVNRGANDVLHIGILRLALTPGWSSLKGKTCWAAWVEHVRNHGNLDAARRTNAATPYASFVDAVNAAQLLDPALKSTLQAAGYTGKEQSWRWTTRSTPVVNTAPPG